MEVRGVIAWTLAGLGATLMTACAGDVDDNKPIDDDGHEERVTCATFVNSLVDCDVLTGSRLAGCDDAHPLLPCMTDCVENASCEEIEAAYCVLEPNTYADCIAACEAAQPAPNFLCNNGEPIQARWRCDGAADCPNGEDEECPTGNFTCDDGLDIPAGWQCDGVPDCGDGEDELDCNGAPPLACGDGTSVPPSRQCDGASDCADGEDERDCTRLTCG